MSVWNDMDDRIPDRPGHYLVCCLRAMASGPPAPFQFVSYWWGDGPGRRWEVARDDIVVTHWQGLSPYPRAYKHPATTYTGATE